MEMMTFPFTVSTVVWKMTVVIAANHLMATIA